MKKLLSLFMLLILTFSFIACTQTKNDDVKIEKIKNLYKVTIKGKNYTELVELGAYKSQKDNSNIINVWVYGKNNGESYTPILVVETQNSLLATALVECATYYPLVYIGDVNGDNDEEIIVNNVRTAMGIGEYKLQIFETKNELTSIYDFPRTDYVYYGPNANIPYDELNFGFTGELLDNFNLCIQHSGLNYKKTITLAEEKIDTSFYDEEGIVLNKNVNVIKFNTFYNIEVKDIDNDGVCEIIGDQNVSYGTIKSIGTATIILKYQQDASFKPIQVEFSEEWQR